MQGKRIAEPMRYLCSALLAIVAALFLNLFFALWSSRSHKADRRQVMTDCMHRCRSITHAHNSSASHVLTVRYLPAAAVVAIPAAVVAAAVTPVVAAVTVYIL